MAGWVFFADVARADVCADGHADVRACDDRFETALPRQGAGECRMAAKIWD